VGTSQSDASFSLTFNMKQNLTLYINNENKKYMKFFAEKNMRDDSTKKLKLLFILEQYFSYHLQLHVGNAIGKKLV